MNVQSAMHGHNSLELVIDGHNVVAGEKYSFIEMGYAILMPKGLDEETSKWLASATETIPGDKDDNRGPYSGSDSVAVTSHPVVVALSYADWWARNTGGFKFGNAAEIPPYKARATVAECRRWGCGRHMAAASPRLQVVEEMLRGGYIHAEPVRSGPEVRPAVRPSVPVRHCPVFLGPAQRE